MNLEAKIIIYKFTPQVFTLTPEYDRFRCSNRWSKKGGARISTEQDYFSLICNILRIKKACMVSYFCPTKKL